MSEINKNREVDGTARVRGKSVYIKTLGWPMGAVLYDYCAVFEQD